jgi:hypothetical protein
MDLLSLMVEVFLNNNNNNKSNATLTHNLQNFSHTNELACILATHVIDQLSHEWLRWMPTHCVGIFL